MGQILENAKAIAQFSMDLALDRAERDSPDWPKAAYKFLQDFIRTHEFFISEDVSDAARIAPGFPNPATDRAWGSIYRKANRAGLIEMSGVSNSRRRHASICPMWHSLKFVKGA